MRVSIGYAEANGQSVNISLELVRARSYWRRNTNDGIAFYEPLGTRPVEGQAWV